ncbi:hypothetical protein [Sphingopyxis sp. NJF-3]
MKLVRHTVRLSAEVDKAVLGIAKERGLTAYAMLSHIVEAGVAALAGPATEEDGNGEVVSELASLGTRLADIEGLLDRTLFTACAAYGYARSAAMGGGKSDETISGEVGRAYERQRAIAEAGT